MTLKVLLVQTVWNSELFGSMDIWEIWLLNGLIVGSLIYDSVPIFFFLKSHFLYVCLFVNFTILKRRLKANLLILEKY